VKEFNEKYGTNFGIAPDKTVTDRLPKSDAKDKISKEGATATQKQLEGLLNFLKQLFPDLNTRIYTREKFEQLKRERNINPLAEAFIQGDTIVLPQDLKDVDVILEEHLHPLVTLLQKQRSEIFWRLHEEAKRLFPQLEKEINESYSQFPQSTRENELVTQALSRYFRQDLGRNKSRHNKFKEWAEKFIRMVKNLFQEDVLPSLKLHKNTRNRIIELNDLHSITSLADLTTVLNTEGISFNVKEGLNN